MLEIIEGEEEDEVDQDDWYIVFILYLLIL
jgi:hypothetical protein